MLQQTLKEVAISLLLFLAGFVKTLYFQINKPLPSSSFFCSKTITNVANIKSKSVTIPFLFFSSYLSPFLFLCLCNFRSYQNFGSPFFIQLAANFAKFVLKNPARFVLSLPYNDFVRSSEVI